MALLGHPVAHSVSPQIHNAAFAATGFDAVYVALDVAPDAVPDALAGLRSLGLLGANVTVPHKRAVYDAVPRRTETAERSGAVNTLFWDDGDLVADNTDIEGLVRVLTNDVGLRGGEEVLMLGAGGAARAAALALGSFGVALEVVARRPDAADDVARMAVAAGATSATVSAPSLVINATPLGLKGEPLPDRFMALGEDQTAMDLVYRPAPTPFLEAAARAGAATLDGRGMLVGQAAAAFERWTGIAAPYNVMVTAMERALAAAP